MRPTIARPTKMITRIDDTFRITIEPIIWSKIFYRALTEVQSPGLLISSMVIGEQHPARVKTKKSFSQHVNNKALQTAIEDIRNGLYL